MGGGSTLPDEVKRHRYKCEKCDFVTVTHTINRAHDGSIWVACRNPSPVSNCTVGRRNGVSYKYGEKCNGIAYLIPENQES